MIDWQIIDKSLDGKLNDAELLQLQEWLNSSASHQQLYDKIKTKREYALDEKRLMQWRKDFDKKLIQIKQRCRIPKIWRLGSVAAAAVILFMGTYWIVGQRQKWGEPVKYVAYQEPDRNNVRLTTAGGKTLELSSLLRADTLIVDGVKVTREQQMLAYDKGIGQESGTIAENMLEVPRGAEFRLTLSDGTRVWINSETKISYPVAFTGKNRKVVLSGEAYFEVARNEEKPFIVHSNGIDVIVLGTVFNVNTRDPKCVQTTLVEGKVQLTTNGRETLILKPGEMATADIETGKIKASTVNVKKYTAWRYGEYFFEDASVEDILNELALWYNVEIVYQDNQVKQEKFSGCLPRSESITSLLNKIEQTTMVHFSVQQHRVIVNQ